MPSFRYIARNHEADKLQGSVVSKDLKSAAADLSRQGLVLISISPDRSHKAAFSELYRRLFFSKLLFLSVFTSSFGRLLASGLTIPQSTSILSKQFRRNLYLRNRLQKLAENLLLGEELSRCMTGFPELFPGYLVTLCKAGESSGCLSEVMRTASEFFERLRKLKNKLASAMVYPSFLATLAMLTVGLLFAFILPKITFVYDELGAELPWETRLILGIGDFVSSYYLMLLIILLLGAAAILFVQQGRKKSRATVSFKHRLPVIGKILSRAELADQLSVTAMLLHNGVSLPEAIRVTTSLTGNQRQKADFENISQQVETGRSLSTAIADVSAIPGYAKDIITLGEEADCLAESLENSSEIIKGDVEQRLTVMTTLFEPMLVLVIALLIGFIIFSILLPITNLDFLIE